MLKELLRLKCEVWFWSLGQREKSIYISYFRLHSAWSKVFTNASYFIYRVRPLQSFKFYICLDVNLNIMYYLCISHNIQSRFKYWKPRCVKVLEVTHQSHVDRNCLRATLRFIAHTTFAHVSLTKEFRLNCAFDISYMIWRYEASSTIC